LPELPNANLIQDVLRVVGIDVDEFRPIPRRVFETLFMLAVKMGAMVGLADDGAIVSRYIRIRRLSSAK